MLFACNKGGNYCREAEQQKRIVHFSGSCKTFDAMELKGNLESYCCLRILRRIERARFPLKFMRND